MVYPNIANLVATTQKYIGTEYKKKLEKINQRVEDIERTPKYVSVGGGSFTDLCSACQSCRTKSLLLM